MTIGKREQIVIGSISAIALIALLHLLIFAPSAASFKQAKETRDSTASQIKTLRTIQDENVVVDFDKRTSGFLKQLETGVNMLKLDEPEVFKIPLLADMQVDNSKLKPGQLPEDWKKDTQKEIAKQKLPEQLKLIMAEAQKLRAHMADKSIQLSFMGSATQYGWRIPDQLPANLNGSVLWDQLKQIAENKFFLDKVDKMTATYNQTLFNYQQAMKRGLGLDMEQSASLARFGTFVPAIQRLCYADLILKRAESSPTPFTIGGNPLTLDSLFNILQIEISSEPIPEIEENKPYFLYEELRGLNYLITVAKQAKVKDITAVYLRGYGFVRKQADNIDYPDERVATDILRLPDDESDDPRVWATPQELSAMTDPSMIDPVTGMPLDPAAGGAAIDPATGAAIDPTMMGMTAPIAEGPTNKSKPKPDEDLGYAVPIRVSFVASNTAGFSYLYELLRQKPMAELHRLIMRSTSVPSPALTVPPAQVQPTNTDIEMTATILFIPKLFKTLETIHQVIAEINGVTSGTQAAAAPLPGAPGAPAAPAP